MARTTSALVQAVLMADYRPGADLSAAIATATMFTDRVASCATDHGDDLTSTELELIERWLAAHFYAVSDRPYAEKKTGNASGKFDGYTGRGLEATLYGQQAMVIDPSGCVSTIGSSQRVGIDWFGKGEDEQIDYEERN